MGRYENTKINRSRVTKRRKQSFLKHATTLYDRIPERNDDIFIITQEGDRLDNLATTFYGNPHLWWYIAKANNLFTLNVSNGTSLRIPAVTGLSRGT